MEMPETIKLPDDEELVRRLKLKLEEYKERRDPYLAPECQPGTICKVKILSTLLKNGTVNAANLREEMMDLFRDSFDEFYGRSFYNAYMVIHAYVTGQTSRVRNSAGLPK